MAGSEIISEALVTELATQARRLSELGFMACTAGNLSARTASGDIAMSPSGMDKGSLVAQDFIMVGEDGRPIPPDSRKPSDETLLHMNLYRETGCGAICHGHVPYAVALSMDAPATIRFHGLEMQKAIAGIISHETECLLPVIENSQDMHELSRRAVSARKSTMPAILVRGHGVYAWGKSVAEASRHLEAVEWLCRIVMLTR